MQDKKLQQPRNAWDMVWRWLQPVGAAARNGWGGARHRAHEFWMSPHVAAWRGRVMAWQLDQRIGVLVMLVGTAVATLVIVLAGWLVGSLPNPGVVYLPLIAMLSYHWGWRLGVAAAILQLACVYAFYQNHPFALRVPSQRDVAQLVTLAAVTAFILALVQLAASRRSAAEREAGRFAALNSVGQALTSELNEERLLHVIARTARDRIGADFAAFTLRPVDAFGQPIGPSEGSHFHLAAVVGVTPEQEELFRRIPLGGEGLLAPIFRFGVPVRVPDALAIPRAHMHTADDGNAEPGEPHESARDRARRAALAYAHGEVDIDKLRTVGHPRGHPIIRSFLGAPLLDRSGQVRGGLLLGHSAPDRFTRDDEALLLGLAAQATVALENARLFRAAQAQARELDTIFETISDGVALVNEHGEVVRENRAARELRDQLAMLPSGDELLRALVEVPVARALRGDEETATTVHVEVGATPDEARDYLVSASQVRSPREDGVQGPGAVVVWRDVTETRRLLAERQARAAAEGRRALLQMVVDELPSAVYLVRGADARLVLANRAARDVWGAEWPEGMPMATFLESTGTSIVGADGRLIPVEELVTLRAVRTGTPVRHHQEIIRRADGAVLPILYNAVALHSAVFDLALGTADTSAQSKEGVASALVVLQDVSALKEAERLKDEFIALAAHELRNPMAAVKGYSDMLVRRSGRGDGEAALADWQMEALETIDAATTRLVELTDDLLDVTRLQAGRLELHLETHDLVALARRVVKRLRVTAARHTLVVETDREYVLAEVDVKRMEQVLGNLLNNAIKYSPDGGRVEVTICADEGRKLAEIRVRDEGIGIPASQQARMFSRFARAENASALGITGSGLGLYLCRELVERHNGRIWFESTEGQGTTFFVTLPLADG